jgi:LacI family transcriptional regulator, fructose operon transcriptional repressor
VAEMIDRVFELIDTPPRDSRLLIEVQPEIMGV